MKKPILWNFALWLIATRIAMSIIAIICLLLFAFELSSFAISIAPILGAATASGQKFARENGRSLTANEAWRFAVQATIVFICVEVAVTSVFGLILAGPDFFQFFAVVLSGSTSGVFIGLMLFYIAIAFFSIRCFVSITAKREIKAMEKRALKGT